MFIRYSEKSKIKNNYDFNSMPNYFFFLFLAAFFFFLAGKVIT
jgi:hypothetical protein